MTAVDDKAAIVAAMVAALEEQLAVLTRSAKAARDGATSGEARAENQYDTRGLEASYLAGAQAARADELRAQITELRLLKPRAFKKGEPVDVGALVELQPDEGPRGTYLLLQGRGMAVTIAGKSVHVVTPNSPLGRELIGKAPGDVIDVEVRGEDKSYEVKSVR